MPAGPGPTGTNGGRPSWTGWPPAWTAWAVFDEEVFECFASTVRQMGTIEDIRNVGATIMRMVEIAEECMAHNAPHGVAGNPKALKAKA